MRRKNRARTTRLAPSGAAQGGGENEARGRAVLSAMLTAARCDERQLIAEPVIADPTRRRALLGLAARGARTEKSASRAGVFTVRQAWLTILEDASPALPARVGD